MLGKDLGKESRQESRQELEQELKQETYFSRILFLLMNKPMSRNEISLGLKSISGHLNRVISELIEKELIDRTIPDKPQSSKQQYKLTDKGIKFIELIELKK